jgi:hypothetical protein
MLIDQRRKAAPLRGTASGAPRAALWPRQAPPVTPAPSLLSSKPNDLDGSIVMATV